MSRCQRDRARRKRNRRANQRARRQKTLAHLYATVPLNGNARPYYEPFAFRFSKRNGGSVTYKIRPTWQYTVLMDQLIAMCGDMTVDLSAFRKPESEGAA